MQGYFIQVSFEDGTEVSAYAAYDGTWYYFYTDRRFRFTLNSTGGVDIQQYQPIGSNMAWYDINIITAVKVEQFDPDNAGGGGEVPQDVYTKEEVDKLIADAVGEIESSIPDLVAKAVNDALQNIQEQITDMVNNAVNAAIAGLGDIYVKKSGDTMSGALYVRNSDGRYSVVSSTEITVFGAENNVFMNPASGLGITTASGGWKGYINSGGAFRTYSGSSYTDYSADKIAQVNVASLQFLYNNVASAILWNTGTKEFRMYDGGRLSAQDTPRGTSGNTSYLSGDGMEIKGNVDISGTNQIYQPHVRLHYGNSTTGTAQLDMFPQTNGANIQTNGLFSMLYAPGDGNIRGITITPSDINFQISSGNVTVSEIINASGATDFVQAKQVTIMDSSGIAVGSITGANGGITLTGNQINFSYSGGTTNIKYIVDNLGSGGGGSGGGDIANVSQINIVDSDGTLIGRISGSTGNGLQISSAGAYPISIHTGSNYQSRIFMSGGNMTLSTGGQAGQAINISDYITNNRTATLGTYASASIMNYEAAIVGNQVLDFCNNILVLINNILEQQGQQFTMPSALSSSNQNSFGLKMSNIQANTQLGANRMNYIG